MFSVHGDTVDHFPIARANRWNPKEASQKRASGGGESGNFRGSETSGGRGFGGSNYGQGTGTSASNQRHGGGGVKITINKRRSSCIC